MPLAEHPDAEGPGEGQRQARSARSVGYEQPEADRRPESSAKKRVPDCDVGLDEVADVRDDPRHDRRLPVALGRMIGLDEAPAGT